MALTYGFYNSVASDRLYNARQMSQIFDGVIIDGVFQSIGDKFMVVPNTGLTVSVGTGRAWFDSTWTYNDADLSKTLDTADAFLPRIDIIALEINTDDAVRANDIKIVKGTPASTPIPPTLTNTSLVHQYPLAHISIPAGLTTILVSHITNKVGTVDCPYATGPADLAVQTLESKFNIHDHVGTNDGALIPESGLAAAVIAKLVLNGNAHNHVGGDGGAIIAGGLANGAVDTTERVANNIIDDTKVGNRVPQFIRRKGGNSTDWSIYGTTNYTPTMVIMQAGVVITTAGSDTTVTFPVAFSNVPIIIIGTGSSAVTGDINPQLVSFTASSFVVKFIKGDGVRVIGAINWLAIGPE